MLLIALALGLILEQLATNLLHLRELRLFDRYYDAAIRFIADWPPVGIYAGLVLILALPALPVLIVSLALRDADVFLWDLAYLSFAVVIIFLCLGPRDLGREVDDYCDAKDRGDDEAADRVLFEMSESEHPHKSDIDVVEEAIFIQSNNRIFGVIFWLVVLGPVGAWIFRVTDLMRRRVAFEHVRGEQINESVLIAIEAIYGVLKWMPARLAMIGYAFSASFDDAMNAWRGELKMEAMPIDIRNDMLIARVGKAAMTGYLDEPENSSAAARNSMRVVRRTVFIWVFAIALLTLFGLAL